MPTEFMFPTPKPRPGSHPPKPPRNPFRPHSVRR